MLSHIQPEPPEQAGARSVPAPFDKLVQVLTSGASLKPVMEDIVRRLGFDSFVYASSTDPKPDRDSRSYVWTTLPDEWVAACDRNSYVEIDPRVTAGYDRITPVIWDSATIKANHRVRQFLAHAAQFGIRSGVVVQYNKPSQPIFGAGFNCSISPIDTELRSRWEAQLADLMLFTAKFHELFMTHVTRRNIPPPHRGTPLSAREIQCLQFAAHGFTSVEIGMKLDIAERTVNFHFSNIVSKLDVFNRSEAISKGVATGLIKPRL